MAAEFRVKEVVAPDGVRLHVRETGPEDAPAILFIHGWSQSWLSWKGQFESELAERFRLVAFDLRGHGMSDEPRETEAYTEARRWADDVDALITGLELDRPILVGWSFGGYVTCDYLRAHGQAAVAALNLVDWAVMIGDTPKERALTGDGFNDYFEGSISDDLPTSIEAMIGFVDECYEKPISKADRDLVLAFNILVSPFVRKWVATRGALDNSDLLRSVALPVLVSQGELDTITRRAAAAHIVSCCPNSRESVYEGVGHMPFLEEAPRFNRELAEFATEVFAAR
ncbi:MAG TPA: alpha/beta hydrolase [Solirubrobacterales bacterium]